MNSPYPTTERFDVKAITLWTLRNRMARVHYQEAKEDAARPEGCDCCTRAFWPDDKHAEQWLRIAGLLFCGQCRNLTSTRRTIAACIAERRAS